MQIRVSSKPFVATSIPSKSPSLGKSRTKGALPDPLRTSYRVLSSLGGRLYFALLNLCCDVLFRWGVKLGVSGNFRGKMYWKAGRREIVPLPQLYDYMRQERPDGEYYRTAPSWSSRSESVLNLLSPLITKESSILEIGCNVGRNMNHLWQSGYRNLRGMEISEHAVRRLRVEYSCLAAMPVDIGPAEESIKEITSNSIDVIFTMSVLEHLHPDSRFLFNEIARVAGKYVLAIEPRAGKRSHMQYPWDIKNEFTAVGLTCIDTKPWSVLWAGDLTPENEWAEAMHDYDALLFRVNPHPPASEK